jgi:hypothetical protein
LTWADSVDVDAHIFVSIATTRSSDSSPRALRVDDAHRRHHVEVRGARHRGAPRHEAVVASIRPRPRPAPSAMFATVDCAASRSWAANSAWLLVERQHEERTLARRASGS